MRNLRLALRGFRRAPAFFLTAVVVLALGIGMSVAMFTVFRTVLVQRLPVVDQDRVVVLWTYASDPNTEVSAGTKVHSVVRRESRTLRDVAAVAHWPATSSPFEYGDHPVELNRGMVTGNFFDVLGARPALGRLLHASDDEAPNAPFGPAGGTRALVLTYRAWRQKFGGDSSVVGGHLVEPLGRTEYAIVGVAPPGLVYPAGADYWIPMWSGWQSGVSAFAVARLAPGASVSMARDEYASLEQRHMPELRLRGAHAATFTDTLVGDVRPVMALLTAAVALLLLIACLNVGTLLLLRASTRERELAVRRALGASTRDIVRQLLTEALAIAVIGGALGLGIAESALRILIAVAPTNVPRLDDVRLSGAPVAATVAVTMLSVLLFGVIPALVIARGTLASALRLDSRIGSETSRRRRMRHVLVASQLALATVMLGGAALLTRSLAQLENQDTGFVSDHLSILWFSWNVQKEDTDLKIVRLGDRLARRVRAIPGVTAVTPMVAEPMLGNGVWRLTYATERQAQNDSANSPLFTTELIGPEFFRTFGVRLVRGRAFTERDDEASALVAIVSESVARQLWPGSDPIGQRLRTPNFDSVGTRWRTIVGIAHDTHLRTLREPSPTVFLPSMQSSWQGSIAIRSTTPLESLIPTLRSAAREVDPGLALWAPRTMDQILAAPLAQPRLSAFLTSSFGIVALLLAAIGLFGVMASLVRERTREFGIRMALGATPQRVRMSVLGRAAVVAGSGVAVGLVAALASSRLLTALLFGVSPTDPIALGVACVVLFGVAAIAAYLPAHRATAIDPAQTLRSE